MTRILTTTQDLPSLKHLDQLEPGRKPMALPPAKPRTDARIKGIGHLQLDEGSPLVISIVAYEGTYFTI